MSREELRRHGRLPTFGGLIAVAAVSAAAALPASAADEFEGNDSQSKATKMQPGKTYDADIDKLDDAVTQTKGDVDWYSLDAAAGQVDIAYTALQDQSGCFAAEARLLDAGGKNLGTAQPAKGDTEHIKYNAPTDGLLYLRVQQYQIDSCDAPIPYRLEPEFTAASGGGGDNGAIDGLELRVKKSQKQRGNKVQVKLRVGAAEDIAVAAKGGVKAGKKNFKLSKVATTVAAGKTSKLALSTKGRSAKRIISAIADGQRVKAKLKIAIADTEGNAEAVGLSTKLR